MNQQKNSFFSSTPWWLKAIALLILGILLGRWFTVDEGFAVKFTNADQQQITSIKLDFGSSNSQSSIQTFRLAPQESRVLYLNHPLGAGFNVLITYANGRQQEFCVLKDNKKPRPELKLEL
ncbi:MAG: hypothetical protein GX029_13195 [Pseudomonadaceae bacterium]|nr:hypothetical protein [Pseudomonadaceae bacterium]